MLQEFTGRFNDFNKILPALRLAASPHSVEREHAALDVQPKLAEVKNDEQLLTKFEEKGDLIEVWKLAVEYSKLRELAINILVFF